MMRVPSGFRASGNKSSLSMAAIYPRTYTGGRKSGQLWVRTCRCTRPKKNPAKSHRIARAYVRICGFGQLAAPDVVGDLVRVGPEQLQHQPPVLFDRRMA